MAIKRNNKKASDVFSFVEQLLVIFGCKLNVQNARMVAIIFGAVMGGFMPIIAFVSSHVWYNASQGTSQWVSVLITLVALGYSLPKVAKFTMSALGKSGGICMALAIEAGMILSVLFDGWQAITLGYICLGLLVITNAASAANELFFACKRIVTWLGKGKRKLPFPFVFNLTIYWC
jgi:hypothetical protein